YNERIRHQFILLENPEKKSRIALLHAAQVEKIKKAKERRRLGVIGRNEAVEKGMWKLKKEQARWELFIPLHRLWLGYMSELLGLAALPASGTPSPKDMPSSAGMHAKLVKADFHGSIMTVRRSNNPALIGLSGIVVHETENAFRVVTRTNKSKLIPKHGSVFAFAVPLYSTLDTTSSSSPAAGPSSSQSSKTSNTVLEAPHIELELYGNQFQFRSVERASKKFKPKETIEL
ncbi:RNase P, partial [Heterobasidion irregulare TC 32-1]